MTTKKDIPDKFDSIEVFDSSVFVEIIVKGEKEKKSQNAIDTVKNGDTRLPATTHEALGEVTDVLMDKEVFESEHKRIEARKEFSSLREEFTLLTPKSQNLAESLKDVKEEDKMLDPTDALILAKSKAFNANRVYTLDRDWSLDSLNIKKI